MWGQNDVRMFVVNCWKWCWRRKTNDRRTKAGTSCQSQRKNFSLFRLEQLTMYDFSDNLHSVSARRQREWVPRSPHPSILIQAYPFPIQFPDLFPHYSGSHLNSANSRSLSVPIPETNRTQAIHRLHSVSRSTYTQWAGEARQRNKHVEI